MTGDPTKHKESIKLSTMTAELLTDYGPQGLPLLVLRFPRGSVQIAPSIAQSRRIRKLADSSKDPSPTD